MGNYCFHGRSSKDAVNHYEEMSVSRLFALLFVISGYTKPARGVPLRPVCDPRVMDRFIKEARDAENAVKEREEACVLPEDLQLPVTNVNVMEWDAEDNERGGGSSGALSVEPGDAGSPRPRHKQSHEAAFRDSPQQPEKHSADPEEPQHAGDRLFRLSAQENLRHQKRRRALAGSHKLLTREGQAAAERRGGVPAREKLMGGGGLTAVDSADAVQAEFQLGGEGTGSLPMTFGVGAGGVPAPLFGEGVGGEEPAEMWPRKARSPVNDSTVEAQPELSSDNDAASLNID